MSAVWSNHLRVGASLPDLERQGGWVWLRKFLGLEVPRPVRGLHPARSGLGHLGVLSVWVASMLVVVAVANNANLRGEGMGSDLLWLAILGIVLPCAARLSWPNVGPQERISTVLLLAVALYMVRILHNPDAFVNHDEFLHWRSVNDILDSHRLFMPNPLLPIGPSYPGLAALTATLIEVTGASVFVVGAVLIGAARCVFILSAYGLFRAISGSARIAAMGALVCMASSNFVFFHGQFSYESLAIALAALCFATAARINATETSQDRFLPRLPLFLLPMAGLALTHHLSAYFVIATLAMVAAASLLVDRRPATALRYAVLAGAGAALCAAWHALVGDHTGGYLRPILDHAFTRLGEILQTGTLGRKLFVSAAGDVMPAWQRWITLASVALIGVGLLTGTARAWHRRVPADGLAWVLVLVLLAASYPLCVALRLDPATWEIGNRLGTYVFLPAAYVIAHAMVGLWQAESTHPVRTGLVAVALSVMVLGGIVAGDGPLVQQGPYLVGGENRAIDAEGINVARWTKDYLGADHVVAGDRTNRLLSSVYGHQRFVTSLSDQVDVSSIFLEPVLGPEQVDMIRQVGIEYLMTDDRLTTRLPWVGYYYEMQEAPGGHTAPISLGALHKFEALNHVSRVYDSGNITVYDIRGLHERR